MKRSLMLISLLLSGCAHTWNPVDYGVQPNGQASVLRSINELPESEIQQICGAGRFGCVKDGNVYYQTGDECALRHELHHVMQGGQHTVKYHQNILQGKGRTCPV